MNSTSSKVVFILFFSLIITLFAESRQQVVTGGPHGIHPYLFKGSSEKNLVETARMHQWSLQFHKSKPDTLHIIAIRVEFAEDTAVQTTGSGLFGIRSGGDKEEKAYYDNDTTYIYDTHPHDSLYFCRQLEAVKKYFTKVSRGNLTLEYSVYPPGNGESGYVVDTIMPFYSPGGKKRKESWDEYYERKTLGLITFVRDAIEAADANKDISPFTHLHYETSDNTIRDELGRKTVFLIFHAGASYLTDGGEEGSLGQDTPSDMIDAFITPDFFKYYHDTLELSENGVKVTGNNGQFLIDELMMCSETSNQDGLNWGIQGIIINQIARQLGIPDLFSTSSGISGIGAFCIMDFAGYSAGKGFFPSYPSAWVRAFMGWDHIISVPVGISGSYNVKALSSVLDRDTIPSNTTSDTTILLVPINDHEYYLIENRQRNLSRNTHLFNYDTLDKHDDNGDSIFISGYPYIAHIDSCILSVTGKNKSNVIQRVNNNDIAIPASGVLVWHIDEKIIRDRLPYNKVNADSLYRGISLVEADGIGDLGIMFQDVFYQAVFDYGGAEDVFPHATSIENKDTTISVSGFGPFTFPSSRANDGGHSYLEVSITPSQKKPGLERSALAKNDGYHYVTNYSDSVFSVAVKWNYLVPGWPKQAVPGRFFDPVLVDIDNSETGSELFLLDVKGRVYVWSSDSTAKQYNSIPTPINRVNLFNDTIIGADTIYYFDSLPNVAAMPSTVMDAVFIPSYDKKLFVFRNLSDTSSAHYSTIDLESVPSTYLCNYSDSSWVIGCENGRVIFGIQSDTVRSVRGDSEKPVCAIAAMHESPHVVAVIQTDGTLSLINDQKEYDNDSSVTLPETAIPPFALVTGNLDNDENGNSEIVVTDSRQGMWVFTRNLKLASGWTEEPSDWPSYYSDTTSDRRRLPVNESPPSLADIDRDGFLDILIGGTNGLYAFNYKGALKDKWPAFLDKYFWYQRGSITSSPVVVTGSDRKPLILFSSVTGENATYRITKVTKANRSKGIVWYKRESGSLDSIWDLTPMEIDTILDLNDSLIAAYTIPGGIIDAVNDEAKRPRSVIQSLLQSPWPITTGSSLHLSPLIGFMDKNNTPDLFAISTDGSVYRWELPSSLLPDTLFWPQNGYNNGRSFAYGGTTLEQLVTDKQPITYFSFPNPTSRTIDKVLFKYKFNAPATKVRLDIYTYTGIRMHSQSTMGAPPHHLTGSYPDWNIYEVSVRDFPPGIYRCRLEATIDGKKHHSYWKLAIIK